MSRVPPDFDFLRRGRSLSLSPPPPWPAGSGRPVRPRRPRRVPTSQATADTVRCQEAAGSSGPTRRALTFLQRRWLLLDRPARALRLRSHSLRPQPATRQQSVSHFKFPRAAA